MVDKYYQNTKKNSKRKHVKNIKIFLKKKKVKGEKRSEIDIRIFLKIKNKNYVNI